MPAARRAQAPSRILLLEPTPRLDCGRYAPKRCVGDTVRVGCTIVADGHDVLRAVVKWRAPGAKKWAEAPLTLMDRAQGGDRWEGEFPVDACGRWSWSLEAWIDDLASWRHELDRKVAAGEPDLSSELSEGALLLEAAAVRAKGEDAKLIRAALELITDDSQPQALRCDAALGHELAEACDRHPARGAAAKLAAPLEVDVDRVRARFGSWYELFPRSWGGLRGTAEVVPQIAQLGFDVLYLPPIHPIGVTNRKGPNNTLTAGPDDPGSVYAIGDREHGGHEALHPDLGTWEDFDHLVKTCEEHGMDLALDLAIQCSPDHPWLEEHPEWFHRRPDGTLKYAENPPKKYQDIYNVNFQCEDWKGLWDALLEVVQGWVDRGVKVFRVDNPHTKPVAFWEWLIGAVRAEHPEVIFLSEAFTRAAMMRTLGKAGFGQSYTYFTWKTSRWELEQFVLEHAYDWADEVRPNFFTNTPDILHESLQHGGPPMFATRLVLAATLSPSYGIYSGFERFENVPVREGSEEYLDSEKYEVKERTLDGAPLLGLVRLLNDARRANPALQHLSNVEFLDTRTDGLIAYVKRHEGNTVIVVCCLDAHHVQEGEVWVPWHLDLPERFQVQDLLDGSRYDWGLGGNYVRLGPPDRQAHVLRVVTP
ncbi:alpha-1,4-glucan--maltose-1-phosphate maltosyltransferase [Conexibacter sp. SYSU D00693]|uniref:alpha-1,4-glucan--maltose-1-phosphate maltosyltransferase n=1 Tax=Conexibacter sp. SYSU D00693 TaxID=2812560 RepID=UPI00196A7A90|nr:alpha-1,4-glucan--maltose-1-phosphate maltosyltransferase [Conexibacter sp. SYSU D00693]